MKFYFIVKCVKYNAIIIPKIILEIIPANSPIIKLIVLFISRLILFDEAKIWVKDGTMYSKLHEWKKIMSKGVF
jgi:hypothetical protein